MRACVCVHVSYYILCIVCVEELSVLLPFSMQLSLFQLLFLSLRSLQITMYLIYWLTGLSFHLST